MGKHDLIRTTFVFFKDCLKDLVMWNERRCLVCGVPYIPGMDTAIHIADTDSIAVPPRACVHDSYSYEACVCEALCPDCINALRQPLSSYCSLCGQAMSCAASAPVLCGGCLCEPPPWESLHFLGQHTGLLRDMVVRAKFAGNMPLLALLGRMLATCLPDTLRLTVDMIIPLPLHRTRLRERGFNQCVEIGRACAFIVDCPLCTDAMERVVATRHQIGLKDEERRINVRDAFVAHEDIVGGKHILLLDDTMTTGATLHQAANVLYKAGAVSVHVGIITCVQRT